MFVGAVPNPQIENLDMGEVTENSQVFVLYPGLGERHDAHLPLPDAAAAKSLDTVPGGLGLLFAG